MSLLAALFILLTIGWDHSPDPSVTGYRIYFRDDQAANYVMADVGAGERIAYINRHSPAWGGLWYHQILGGYGSDDRIYGWIPNAPPLTVRYVVVTAYAPASAIYGPLNGGDVIESLPSDEVAWPPPARFTQRYLWPLPWKLEESEELQTWRPSSLKLSIEPEKLPFVGSIFLQRASWEAPTFTDRKFFRLRAVP